MNVEVHQGEFRYPVAMVIEALREAGGIRAVAAQKLGCVRSTVTNYVNTFPEVADALLEIEEINHDLAKAGLLRGIQLGEGWAICFYHKVYLGVYEPGGWNPRGLPSPDGPGNAPSMNLRVIPIEKLREIEAEVAAGNAA